MTQQQELTPMAVGSYLKQQRESRNLKLAEVAKAIRLDEKLLADIEEQRAEHVAPVYINGYIQAYAQYLQITAEDLAQMTEWKSGAVDKREPELRAVFSTSVGRSSGDKWLRAMGYVLATLLIGTLVWQLSLGVVRLYRGDSSNPERFEADQGLNTIATNKPRQTAVMNPPIASLVAAYGDQPKDSTMTGQSGSPVSLPPLAEGESRLNIVVSADSWVQINDADGKELVMDLLRGGSDRTYQGKGPFRILFGRASAVRLVVNGEPVDLLPFTKDDVVQMTFPGTQSVVNITEKD